MDYLIRYRFHILGALILTGLALASNRLHVAKAAPQSQQLPEIKVVTQLSQASELGHEQVVRAVRRSRIKMDEREFILKVVQASLPESDRHMAYSIARSVIVEANRHHLDPLFLLAVIRTESKFNVHARGRHGEVGLMQIKASTAKWLAGEKFLKKDSDLENPTTNIHIGALYFARLRKTFHGKGTRYVAAYNMGARNVRRLVATRTEPKVYPDRVLENYRDIYADLAQRQPLALATRQVASAR